MLFREEEVWEEKEIIKKDLIIKKIASIPVQSLREERIPKKLYSYSEL